MKKIVFTVTNDLTYDQRMHRICSSLANNGFDVLLVGRALPSSIKLQNKAFKQKRIKCFFTNGFAFYAEYNIRLFFFLQLLKFDIGCAIDLDTILPVLLSCQLKNKKKVYDAHEYFTQVPEVINRPKVQQIWRQIEKFSVAKMDCCYSVSGSLVTIFENLYHKKFHLIRNIPIKKEVPIPENFYKKTILYQGAVNVGRGLEDLVNAMTKLDAFLIIAGDGDILPKIKNLVNNLGIEEKVQFTGYLTPEKLNKLTYKATIGYNLLEKESESYFYSLSNKFFSYIHAGIPSISSNFPEYNSFNNEYEVAYLADLSVENIIIAVEKLLNNKEYYQQIKKNCLLAREEVNWQQEEKKLIEIYREL